MTARAPRKNAEAIPWRVKYAATGKLGINVMLSGEEARAVVEIMDAEGILQPAPVGRALIARAISEYPEWGMQAQIRRNLMMEQRRWLLSRIGLELQTIATEIEASIEDDYAKVAAEEVERAQAALTGEGNEDPS